ncbi:uncharacterized protein [Mycetomoellerius zeteki]|uniref:uncharacterized protein n=1 Tax=Mycetomoellerius zeteki TaxID=64791 RepID=UPI00084E6BB6|nr:PREDICTED: uncharacterized protein LOC108720568 [Trachymyrmex zeteki]
MLIQRIWQLDLAWDETVLMDLHTAWTKFESQLSLISELKVPRYVACRDAVSIQIHGFSDASEKARLPYHDWSCDIVLLAQLIDKILRTIRFKPESVYYWTDSMIVIHWIKATDKSWNAFIANRVSEIDYLKQAVGSTLLQNATQLTTFPEVLFRRP